jgi:hypothetical protein
MVAHIVEAGAVEFLLTAQVAQAVVMVERANHLLLQVLLFNEEVAVEEE